MTKEQAKTDPVLLLADTINKTCQAFPKRRLGQNVFNVLYEHYPHEINQLRGTTCDCFYVNSRKYAFIKQWLKMIDKENVFNDFMKTLLIGKNETRN